MIYFIICGIKLKKNKNNLYIISLSSKNIICFLFAKNI